MEDEIKINEIREEGGKEILGERLKKILETREKQKMQLNWNKIYARKRRGT